MAQAQEGRAGRGEHVKRERRRPKGNTRETILLRVMKGALVPADHYAIEKMRARGYRVSDELTAELWKARNPSLHRRAHRLGQLCVDNIEAFDGMNAHEALKKLQREGNIECDVTLVVLANGIEAEARVARSLAYEEMEDGAFRELYLRFCNWISQKYWPELDCYQIEEMAELMEAPV
jgi:hypothetical protein